MHRLRDLHRELAGRNQDQGCGGAALGLGEALEHRQRERRRLAGAGGSLGEQVASGEQRRDRLALDRGRFLVAELGEALEQLGAEPQLGEAIGPFVSVHRAHDAPSGPRRG